MDTLTQIVRNPLRDKLARGEVVASMIVRMARGPEIGRIAATAGFDALYVDLEHSALSLETTALICTTAREAGVTPLVRVPQIEPALIGRVLDAGAMGIVVPHVACAEDAQRAVAAALYPPLGQRSLSSGLAALHYRSFPSDQACAAINASVFIAPMIESRAALEQIDEIAAVPGVDMLFVGAADLAADLGLAGQPGHPELAKAIGRVCDAALKHRRVLGLGGLAGEPALLAEWVARGTRFISAGTDVQFLLKAASQAAAAAKGFLPRP